MNTDDFGGISLKSMQLAFQSALLSQQNTSPEFICDSSAAVSSLERFRVYIEAYRLRLIEALKTDFPALNDYLGDAKFESMARDYIKAFPSDHFSIRLIGRHLPEFLEMAPDYNERTGLKELAAFEWLLGESFDADDQSPIVYEQMAEIRLSEWPSLQILFHPSLGRIDLNHTITEFWRASNRNQALPDIEVTERLQSWVVWRHQQRLFFRSISLPEAIAIDSFNQRKIFSEVCEIMCECLEEEQVVTLTAGYIQQWISEGWIVEVVPGRHNI